MACRMSVIHKLSSNFLHDSEMASRLDDLLSVSPSLDPGVPPLLVAVASTIMAAVRLTGR
jgi:hypothetical protein